MPNQPSLEDLRKRVAQAEVEVPAAMERLKVARDETVRAALMLRDLEYCHNAGILHGDDPELVEAIAQAQQTQRRLSEARVNLAYAQRALTYATDYLARQAEVLNVDSPSPSSSGESRAEKGQPA